MKFIIVADRVLKSRYCSLCCEPIKASYLRDLDTRLPYCGHDCYQEHLDVSALPLGRPSRRAS